MAQTFLVLFPAMRVSPSVEIEADAVLRLTLLLQSAVNFSPTWSRYVSVELEQADISFAQVVC